MKKTRIENEWDFKPRGKSNFYIKIDTALEQARHEILEIDKIKEILEKNLKKKNVLCTVKVIKNHNKIKEFRKNNIMDKSIIFLSFTKSGHVAVVGAGINDLVFSEIDRESRYSTPRILGNACLKSSDTISSEVWKWDKDKAIVIYDLKLSNSDRGILKVDEKLIVTTRRGVEQFVGETLIDNCVPILNYYSHRNIKNSEFKKRLESIK